MAEAKQIGFVNSFVGGLITEATELTFPPNASYDELNADMTVKGNRRKRRGIDFEQGYSLSTFDVASPNTKAVATAYWEAVGGDGSLNFTVLQVGSTLYFYTLSGTSLSEGEKSFTVDLNDYLAPAQTDASTTAVTASSGRGDLFVVSPVTEPIRISYDVDTDTISVEAIEMRIRDFEGVEDGLEVDEEPSTLTKEHRYNLYNQGWYVTPSGKDNVNIYFTESGKYPPNSIQWHTAVKTQGAYYMNASGTPFVVHAPQQGEVHTSNLRTLSLGKTEAPKGHFIIDPFYKDRSAASGIANLPVESTNTRPNTVAFYAGRVCYGIAGEVYISQLLNRRRDNAGKCYQEADPTSEDISDLVDTDGLVIPIPEAGEILALDTVGSSLIVFANNGVWSISGTDGGFKSTDYAITKVSGTGILSRTGLVNADGTLLWWGEAGIFTIRQDNVSGSASVVSLTETTIKSFYLDITPTVKNVAVGDYDKATNTITWLYGEDEQQVYGNILRFNATLSAFYPWVVDTSDCYIGGIIRVPNLSTTSTAEEVETTSGVTVTTVSLDIVTAETIGFTGNSSFIKYLTFVPNGDGTFKVTFSEFYNEGLTDWEEYGIINDTDAKDYVAFIETGHDLKQDAARFKQIPYVIVHCKEPATADGGLTVRAKFNFTDAPIAGKWSTPQQVYRPRTGTRYENPVRSSRLRLRGRGRAIQLRFDSPEGKDFDLLGWGSVDLGNTDV